MMTSPSNPLLNQICTGCGKNGMECTCEQFHPNQLNQPNFLVLDEKEARAIYRVLEYEFIPYEDLEAKKVVDKIEKFVNELAK